MSTGHLPNQQASRPTVLQFQEQLRWVDFQGFGHLDENSYRRGTFAALNPAHIIWVNVRSFGKSLLTKLCSVPIPEHSFADDFICRFRHRCLRKQKREEVTTHAPCRTVYFDACNLAANQSENVMSEVETVTLIRGMRSPTPRNQPEDFHFPIFPAQLSGAVQARSHLDSNVEGCGLQSQQNLT
jgi:hypothetical protein